MKIHGDSDVVHLSDSVLFERFSLKTIFSPSYWQSYLVKTSLILEPSWSNLTFKAGTKTGNIQTTLSGL